MWEAKGNERCLSLKCKKDNVPISQDTITTFVPMEEIVRRNIAATSIKHTFDCPLCMGKVPIEESIMLDCEHRVDEKCFREYLESMIKVSKVMDEHMVCPYPGCKQKIAPAIVEKCVSKEMWERLNNFKLKLTDWGPHEAYKACPDCDFGMFIPTNHQEFACQNKDCKQVNIKICPGCNATPPHLGKTCEQHQQEKRNSKDQREFDDMMAKMGFKKCPKVSFTFALKYSLATEP